MDWSEDRLLACRTPSELFGEDAADPRGLKRAYARLAKRFPPSSGAPFQHLRALYDRARAGETGEAPPSDAAEAPPEARSPQEPAVDPAADPVADRTAERAAALQAAYDAAEGQALFDAVSAHGAALVGGDHDALVFYSVQRLLGLYGPALPPSALLVLRDLLQDPHLRAPPDWVGTLEGGILDLWALGLAAQQEAVPEPLLEALRRSWWRPPEVCAQVWLEAAEGLRAAEVDVEITLFGLEQEHPQVAAMVQRVELAIAGEKGWTTADGWTTEGPARVPKAKLWTLRKLAPEVKDDRGMLPHVGDRYADGPLFYLLIAIFILLTAGGGVLIVGLFFGLRRWGQDLEVEAHLGSPNAQGHLDALPLQNLLREHALFPHELLDAMLPQFAPENHETDETFYWAYPEEHPLVRFQRRRDHLLTTITPAHVARVEAREAAARAAAEAVEEAPDDAPEESP